MDDPSLSWGDLEEHMFMTLFAEKGKPAERRRPLAVLYGEDLKTRKSELLDAIKVLVSQGLLAVRPDDGGAIDVRDPRAVELTKRGYEYGLEITAVDYDWERQFPLAEPLPPSYVSNLTPAPFRPPQAPLEPDRSAELERELAAAREELALLKAAPPAAAAKNSSVSHASIANDTLTAQARIPAVTGKALRDAILREFEARERLQHGLVPIWQVRRAIAGAPVEEFDKTLLQLQREDLVSLMKLNDARDVPDDQIADGVKSPLGNKLFFMARGDRL